MKTRLKKFWELYLAYYTANCIVVLFDLVTEQTDMTTLSLVELLLMVLGAFGLYGLSTKSNLLPHRFGKYFACQLPRH